MFEKEFQKYLANAVASNNNFATQAHNSLDALIEQDMDIKENQKVTNSILSFNYTTPFSLGDRRLYKMKNVHGCLVGEIIFGIDGFNKKTAQENRFVMDFDLPFTKTFRTLSLSETTVSQSGNERNLIGDIELHAIKVFGHSLGKADYSYYQSIFDSVNLYSSKVRLFFYYYPHGQDEAKTKEDTYLRVAKLLEEYGTTLDNKDHGRNLMHKLQLEGRLCIKKYSNVSHEIKYRTINDLRKQKVTY
jgi:hypothetical protein